MIRRARQHAAPPFLPSMWRAGSWGISPVITRWHSQQRSGFASRAQQQKQALLARRRRQRQQAAGAGAGDHRAKGGVAAPRAAALQKKPWEDFAPTQEWQTVEEHHILPPGLEIRVDMSSGSKVARLLPAAPVEVDSTVDELKRADAIVYESYAAAAGAGGGGSGGDRTVQKFTGRDAWKNWVDWDSPHTEQTDELNRRRHFFYHVDSKGRLLRRELGADPPRWPQGQIRDSGFLEYFFAHMQLNPIADYAVEYPFLSRRAHEAYFVSCAAAPVVFNNVQVTEHHESTPGEEAGAQIWLQHLCPSGDIAHTVSTQLEPGSLLMCAEGRLYHPIQTVASYEPGEFLPKEADPFGTAAQSFESAAGAGEVAAGTPVGSTENRRAHTRQRRALQMLAVLESATAQHVLDLVACQETPADEAVSNGCGFSVTWAGVRSAVRTVIEPWQEVTEPRGEIVTRVSQVEPVVETGD